MTIIFTREEENGVSHQNTLRIKARSEWGQATS